MASDDHLDIPLPFGKHKGKSVNSLMTTHPLYMAWFVENIARFTGHTPDIDTLVEQIKKHTLFPRALEEYQLQKAADKTAKLDRKNRKQQPRQLSQSNRRRDQQSGINNRLVPDSQPISATESCRPANEQTQLSCVAVEPGELERHEWSQFITRNGGQIVSGTTTTHRVLAAQVTFRLDEEKHLTGRVRPVARLDDQVGWLALRLMEVTTLPRQFFFIAAARSFHQQSVRIAALESLLPFAIKVNRIRRCHIDSSMKRELITEVKQRQKVCLAQWQQKRRDHLASMYGGTLQTLTAKIEEYEQAHRALRFMGRNDPRKHGLRKLILDADQRYFDTEDAVSQALRVPVAYQVRTVALLEWSVVT